MSSGREGQDRRLPALPGGWEVASFQSDQGPDVELMVPCEPEALLDDDAVQERNRFNDSMPYWAWMWDSAPVMVKLLGSMDVQGRVLEVGAGLGLVGIAVAAARPRQVELTLSDYDPLSVAALRANADRNGLVDAKVWQLDWHDVAMGDEQPFDAVIGCDVIYEAQGHEALLDVIERLMAAGGGRAFIGDPGRPRVPQFLKRARARGFHAVVLDQSGAPAEPAPDQFRLLILSRKPS